VDADVDRNLEPPPPKKQQLVCLDLLGGDGDSFSMDLDWTRSQGSEIITTTTRKTPKEKADDEISRYDTMVVGINDNALKALPSFRAESIPLWWADERVRAKFRALSRAALGFHGMLAGSGGLECDIGALGDIVGRKRASTSLMGMVEAQFLTRINKNLIPKDTTKIPALSSNWVDKIPKRDWVFDSIPDSFLDKGLLEDETGDIEYDYDDMMMMMMKQVRTRTTEWIGQPRR
jgi:hypothetical protein